MGYKILAKKRLAPSIVRMDILAPDVAQASQPGQFVVIIADEKGERIPLTIADAQKTSGSISIIFQEIGFSTICLGRKEIGRDIFAILGPLGHPTHIEKFGAAICVGGGVGIAEILPVARALKNGGNRVLGIIGARSKDFLILEDELTKICDHLFITTDDGSKGAKGFVTDVLATELDRGDCSYVYAVGPVVMMRRVAEITRSRKVKTIVSLNPVMVDATGMCGVCRCRVEGKTVFGCVDGPEFDAHQVDFEELEKRLSFFKKEEQEAKDSDHG